MNNDNLELISVTLMDIRATVESMRRSVTSAQADVERLRHGVTSDFVLDMRRCLDALVREAAIVTESVEAIRPSLAALSGTAEQN